MFLATGMPCKPPLKPIVRLGVFSKTRRTILQAAVPLGVTRPERQNPWPCGFLGRSPPQILLAIGWRVAASNAATEIPDKRESSVTRSLEIVRSASSVQIRHFGQISPVNVKGSQPGPERPLPATRTRSHREATEPERPSEDLRHHFPDATCRPQPCLALYGRFVDLLPARLDCVVCALNNKPMQVAYVALGNCMQKTGELRLMQF